MTPSKEEGHGAALRARWLAATSMLLLAAVFFFYHRYQDEQLLLLSGPFLWGLVLAQIPFAVCLWWFLSLDERKGASLAVGWGSLALGVSLPLLPSVLDRYEEKEIGSGALVAAFLFPVAQVAWIWFATQLHRKTKPQPGERSSLGAGFLRALGFLLLLVLAATLALPNLMHKDVYEAQRRATVALKRIASCAVEYRRRHPTAGFPGDLAALGPRGADCLGPRLAAGEKDGYTFRFTPGTADSSGRRESYAVLARPKITFRPVTYLLDQTGTIRYTSELRNPTASDPILQ